MSLIESLRRGCYTHTGYQPDKAESRMKAAADELERLQGRVEELEKIVSDKPWTEREIVTSERDAARTALIFAEGRHQVVLQLLKVANCPNCDGSGGYYDSHGEPCQCQWCFERNNEILHIAQPPEDR